MIFTCRHCSHPLENKCLDLGHQPPSNAYLKKENLLTPEVRYPLTLSVCTNCWLVQLPEYAKAEELFTPDYAYLSSTSESWCSHAEKFSLDVIKSLNLSTKSLVVEIASNDGYLLKNMKNKGIPNIGIEPTKRAADISKSRGIDTIQEFFTLELAENLLSQDYRLRNGADLIIANNVLAHVPHINDFMCGMKRLLNSHGFISVEFPHLFNLIQKKQFDTIYHEHYSYLSLSFVCRLAKFVGLEVINVEQLNTHGGSLRVWLTHEDKISISDTVNKIISLEASIGLEDKDLRPYINLQENALEIKNNLLYFLLGERKKGNKVVGFGAAAKGNTLLNFAGIKNDLIIEIADNAISKQGLFTPGSHIPIIEPAKLSGDTVLLLPWNLINEIKPGLKNMQVVTAIPDLKLW